MLSFSCFNFYSVWHTVERKFEHITTFSGLSISKVHQKNYIKNTHEPKKNDLPFWFFFFKPSKITIGIITTYGF